MAPELPQLICQHEEGHDRSQKIRNRHGAPDAPATVPGSRDLEEVRQEDKSGKQEEQLPRQRHEDRLSGHADALEEVRGHHLETDDREADENDAHTLDGQPDQLLVGGEQRHGHMREKLADDETRRGNGHGADDRQAQHPQHAVVLPGTEIVARNGLHALVHTHDDHHEDEGQPVHEAVGADHQVAAVGFQALVDQDHDETGREVHQEWRHADGQDITDDLAPQAVDAAAEVDQLAAVRKQAELPHERDDLRENRGNGRPADAPAEAVDEQRVEHGIDDHRVDRRVHRLAGMSRGAQDGVQTQIHVGNDVTREEK